MTGAYHATSQSNVTICRPVAHYISTPPARSREPREFVLSRSDFQIRLGSSETGKRSRVSMLIQRMYAWRGLLTEAPARIDDHPNQITLVASRSSDLFGTLTLRLDAGNGINAEELYPEAIASYRKQGARICELTRLAIDPAFNSKEVLASIFHLAYIYARLIHGMTDLFIEVHPRHVAFYRRMLGFEVAGEERICPRVDAPAVLLHLPLDHVDAQIKAHGGTGGASGKGLYGHFLCEQEQNGLLRRLRSELAQQAA